MFVIYHKGIRKSNRHRVWTCIPSIQLQKKKRQPTASPKQPHLKQNKNPLCLHSLQQNNTKLSLRKFPWPEPLIWKITQLVEDHLAGGSCPADSGAVSSHNLSSSLRKQGEASFPSDSGPGLSSVIFQVLLKDRCTLLFFPNTQGIALTKTCTTMCTLKTLKKPRHPTKTKAPPKSLLPWEAQTP